MSKCNLLWWYGKPKFRFNIYTDCSGFDHILWAEWVEEEAWVGKVNVGGFWSRYHKLHEVVSELLD